MSYLILATLIGAGWLILLSWADLGCRRSIRAMRSMVDDAWTHRQIYGIQHQLTSLKLARATSKPRVWEPPVEENRRASIG